MPEQNVELSPSELSRYARHISLAEIGLQGQKKLKAAKVLVVGAGGLGCPVLQYLTAAGIGKITIVDFDSVKESNLQRQVLYRTSDCGKNKALQAAETLRALNPEIKIVAVQDRFSVENAVSLAQDHDVVVDGTDNFATRYLINDACVVASRPFVSASLTKFRGQVGIFNAALPDGSLGPTYRCLFPTPPAPEDAPDCNAAGVLGVLPGILGTLQANEVLKLVLERGTPLIGRILLIDALTLQTQVVMVKREQQLATKTTILAADEYQQFCRGVSMSNILQITAKDLKARLDSGESITLIDVREVQERAISNIGGEHIPLSSVPQSLNKIPTQGPVVVYCRSGGRSQRACELLAKQHGYKNLMNLEGGMQAWAEDVNPGMPVG